MVATIPPPQETKKQQEEGHARIEYLEEFITEQGTTKTKEALSNLLMECCVDLRF
jgi:hypothetical protein